MSLREIRPFAWGLWLLIVGLLAPGRAEPADERKTPEQVAAETKENEIKPLPLTPIPDDPPPHEGALIDLPYIVEPPDLILVEVLEALPGRPISGERLVRPDGKISLGFYGEVYVRGLTIAQVKEKIIRHLRYYLIDDVLGLEIPAFAGSAPLPPLPGTEKAIAPPVPPPPPPPQPKQQRTKQSDVIQPRTKPQGTNEQGTTKRGSRPGAATRSGVIRRISEPPKPLRAPPAGASDAQEQHEKASPPSTPLSSLVLPWPFGVPTVEIPVGGNVKITIEVQSAANQAAQGAAEKPATVPPNEGDLGKPHPVHPLMSDRVFVDVTAYNSPQYYVLGNVSSPGKLPWTGQETVLDALQYAGVLLSTADPKNIILVRPARGGKPKRVYPVDLGAILTGDMKANYQVFPSDRLIVGRNKIEQTAIEMDRVARSIQTVLSGIQQYTYTLRGISSLGIPLTGDRRDIIPPAQRDAIMKDLVDLWWDAASKPGGAALDEKAFKDMLLRHLNPTAGQRPNAPRDEPKKSNQ